MFPRRILKVSNSEGVLENFLVADITVSPEFPVDYFDGLPEDNSPAPKATPVHQPDYSHAEIGEYTANCCGLESTVEPLPTLWLAIQ
jgi:hypothetical protein